MFVGNGNSERVTAIQELAGFGRDLLIGEQEGHALFGYVSDSGPKGRSWWRGLGREN